MSWSAVARAGGGGARGAAAAVLLVTLLACSREPPAQRLAKQAEPIASWLATLQMTAETWSTNRVPRHFARDTTEAALRAIEMVATSARESEAPPATREPLRRLLAQAHIAGRRLAAAVARGDRQGAAALAPTLRGLEERLQQWQRRTEAGRR